MDEQKNPSSESREDLRKLRRDIEFLRVFVAVLLCCVIALGIRVSRVEDCAGILCESVETLLTSVSLLRDGFLRLGQNDTAFVEIFEKLFGHNFLF